MAENDTAIYEENLAQALAARKDWLETSELVKLKDAIRDFQSSFFSLYNIYLKKKLVNEDPYKADVKISELEVPDSSPLPDVKRAEQMSLRLASFDTQLDFLANFYQLGMDFLNLERIKKILGLIRYIDWVHFSPDSQSYNTKFVAEIHIQAKGGTDQITMSVINESAARLSKSTSAVMSILKDLTNYYKESYKLSIRQNLTKGLDAGSANIPNIKKNFRAAMPPKSVFYQELIEEVLKEDFTENGSELKSAVLKSLAVEEQKPKAVKPQINFKNILLDGTKAIGGANISLREAALKTDGNAEVLASRKKGIWSKIMEIIKQMMNSEPDDIVYEVSTVDQTRGVPVKEELNFTQFRAEMDKKIKILASFVNGPAAAKLAEMNEEQIMGYLEKNIRDVNSYHKSLSALDDYFKSKSDDSDRSKIKGIKPELSTIKNSIVKANQFKFEYISRKEEEDQLRRLGITTETG
ncbi:MAG: hypothetical protein FWG66_02565 [Spirochaetes bacterium]|nr:hypothetical protein [Spirochaetota bacterium]